LNSSVYATFGIRFIKHLHQLSSLLSLAAVGAR
jgi:hypothetical protein